MGLWLILGGLVLVSVAIFVLVSIETTVFGTGALVACGSALAPVPGRDVHCDAALVEVWLLGGGLAVVGIAAVTCGILLRSLTPRPLGF